MFFKRANPLDVFDTEPEPVEAPADANKDE
jgi:hypothetical protein